MSEAIPTTSAEVAAEPTAVDTSFANPVVSSPVETVVPEPVAPSPVLTDEQKALVRANIRWFMTELDYARSGRTAEERARLNP